MIVIVVAVIVLIASLKTLATIYTDALWFSSIHQHQVWTTLLIVKLGLFVIFGLAFFAVLVVNLMVCDRIGAAVATEEPEDEIVKRYQQVVRPYAGRIYAAVALVLALIAASGTVGQWQNWILFRHATSFGVKDPQFHRDVGFFVFRLPFINFVISWSLVSLIVILIVTVVFHYLNGGIRAQRGIPHVRAPVKAHLSVLLALIALDKAAGYYYQRFQLDLSQQGYVEGAGYTDVHARLPALELLIFISIAAAAILLYNIRQRGWTLPVLAIGVWFFVALAAGIVYPWILQTFKVTPSQSTLERPYITDNIQATRTAYKLNHVTQHSFAGASSISPQGIEEATPTLDNIRLWDPDPRISLLTFQKLENTRNYYTFQSVAVDRYTIGSNLTPVLVGVRQIDPQGITSPSWVNSHLQYTHGEGVALSLANQVETNENPDFGVQDVPPASSDGLPKITQPDVYFGLNMPGYVVAHTKQPELDYPLPNGGNQTTTYEGTGGVKISNFLTRAAFSLRLGDFNLLISGLITPQSRIMFVRDVAAMAEKAAPFLSYDADPYAVIVNGHIDWVLDAYTTTDQYPYSQNVDTEVLPGPPNSVVPVQNQIPGSLNYIRNSVKVVVDAYSGQMTFYAMDPSDPILRAYEAAFPHLFTPLSKMSPTLRAHLRYPEDIFSVQAAMYGRYHLIDPSAFYTAANAWSVTPTAGVGSASQGPSVVETTVNGEAVSGPPVPMAPLYQVMAEPGGNQQALVELDAYVSQSASSTTTQNLTALLTAASDPDDYGQLEIFKTPTNESVLGPAQADSKINQSTDVSQKISLLDQHGSQVILGNILIIPIGQSILYIRPLYVESSGNPLPQLNYVIAVYGGHVGMESSLSAALQDVIGTAVPGVGGQPSTSSTAPPSTSAPTSASTANAQTYIAEALSDYAQAQAALKAGNLGSYQSYVAAANTAIAEAQAALGTPPTGSSTTTTIARSTSAGGKSTVTTTSPSSKSGSTHSSASGASSTTTKGSGHPGSKTTTTKPNEA
jgi:uncharacterized membrane protein (UPF0182 family)